jgi:hypothetical protein
VGTNICLGSLRRLINSRFGPSANMDARYTVAVHCKIGTEADLRSLLLHVLSQSGLEPRRIESAQVAETASILVMAHAAARGETTRCLRNRSGACAWILMF